MDAAAAKGAWMGSGELSWGEPRWNMAGILFGEPNIAGSLLGEPNMMGREPGWDPKTEEDEGLESCRGEKWGEFKAVKEM